MAAETMFAYTKNGIRRSHSWSNRQGQGGFTLIEALLAIMISSMVAGVSLSAFIVTIRSNQSVSASLTSSNSALITSSQFAIDVSSVGPVDGVPNPVAAGEPGCGGTPAVLRLVSPAPAGGSQARRSESASLNRAEAAEAAESTDTAADSATGLLRSAERTADSKESDSKESAMLNSLEGSAVKERSADDKVVDESLGTVRGTAGVRVLSYELEGESAGGGRTLRRYLCTGADLNSAIKGDRNYSGTLVADVAPTASPVKVSCDGGEIKGACHLVEMRVHTMTDRVIVVRGTIPSVLQPTPTTAPVMPVAPPTGTCTIAASETTWGATGGAAGSGDGHSGDATMYTYNDTNQRNSYLRFDLTQPCSGADDTWKNLPGGRNLTSVTLRLAYMGKTGDACWIFPGVSKDEQILQPLNGGSKWSEPALRGSNMPTGANSGADYKFKVANQGSLTSHTGAGIVASVKQWYSAGGWTNNGWILRRDGVGDTCGDSNKFASRYESNASLRPNLVITWGP